MNDRDLMRIRADTLFTYDDCGRMVSSNEPRAADRRPAPRLFLGRTADGFTLRLGAALPDDVAREIEGIVARLPPAADLQAPAVALAGVRAALERHAPVAAAGGGPVYRFPDAITPPREAVRLTVANRALARETYPWLHDEIDDWQPCRAVVRDGAAVSVCFSARLSDRAAEAGVDTLPDHRGRGHATAVTLAWAAAVRESGRIPLYSTSWDNAASRGVARRAGLVMFGADTSIS